MYLRGRLNVFASQNIWTPDWQPNASIQVQLVSAQMFVGQLIKNFLFVMTVQTVHFHQDKTVWGVDGAGKICKKEIGFNHRPLVY